MTSQTIPEITSELERLASEIVNINARPFGGRIDIRMNDDGEEAADDDTPDALYRD